MTLLGFILIAFYIYFGFSSSLWFLAGACWGLANLYFIRELLYELLIANPKNPLKIILLALIKFPLLYTIGFGLLYYQNEPFWALITGFSITLALSTQKRFWLAFQSKNRGIA